MDFNENKLINQTYENDWMIEETYRQSDFHQCHFNNITTQDIVFENCYFYQTVFNQCDLSNIKFDNCMFRQVQFNNCKLLGSDFLSLALIRLYLMIVYVILRTSLV